MADKEAIIVVPGFFSHAQDDYLDKLLIPGFINRLENWDVKVSPDPPKIPGQVGRQITAGLPDGSQITIDLYEAYWIDLLDKLGEKSLKEQILRGLYIFIFLFSSQIWRMAKQSRILLFQLMVMVFLLILWYYGNVAVALTVIGENPAALGISLPPTWATTLGNVGRMMGSWPVWAIASIFLALLPKSINTFVDQINFTAHYLEDDADVDTGSIRDRIRMRVKATVDDVLASRQYHRITIVGHSMGDTVAVDLLAEYSKPEIPMRFITLGGQIQLFSYKTDWICEQAAKCLNNSAIQGWSDFYSVQDWLCTKTPLPSAAGADKFESHPIKFKVSFAKQIVGETHIAYFLDRAVLEHLLIYSSPKSVVR